MKSNKIQFPDKDTEKIFFANKDTYYIKFTKIVFKRDLTPDVINNFIQYINITVTIKKNNEPASFILMPIVDLNKRYTNTLYFNTKYGLEESNNNEFDTISINCKFNKYNDEFDLFYETVPLNVSILNPYKDFDHHIKDKFNNRILFSAPFGQGKTTFLDWYFENNQSKYEVFHIFPVNYSISYNEDIFEYIKCEILLQLLERNVDLDDTRIKYFDSLPIFIKDNFHLVMAPLLNMVPKFGGSMYKIFEKWDELKCQYFKYHDDLNITEKDKVIGYLESFYKNKGSLYEDDFFTQTVRQLLQQLYDKGKETVLIVDDLDRIDPEHVFRILNVFAAHFDIKDDSVGANKFGFSKIILVADYNNIRKIFHHRHGHDTDYKGYIDKFYSKEVFYYDNIQSVKYYVLKNIDTMNKLKEHYLKKYMHVILMDLCESECLSLRELIKLDKTDIIQVFQYKNNLIKNELRLFYAFNIISILSSFTDINDVIDKLKKCQGSIKQIDGDYFLSKAYSSISFLCLISLIYENYEESISEYAYNVNGRVLKFIIKKQLLTNGEQRIEVKSINDGTDQVINLGKRDCYWLLLKVAEKYKEMGGFYGKNKILKDE